MFPYFVGGGEIAEFGIEEVQKDVNLYSSSRAFQRLSVCENRLRYSRERAPQDLDHRIATPQLALDVNASGSYGGAHEGYRRDQGDSRTITRGPYINF